MGLSRRCLLQEELGYIDGGSETLVRALVSALDGLDVDIKLATKVEEIVIEDGRVRGVAPWHRARSRPCDLYRANPFRERHGPGSARRLEAQLRRDPQYRGGMRRLYKLRRSVTPYFWVNIADESIDIPGIIEFSSLRPTDETIIYVPYYMPVTHQKWAWTNEELAREAFEAIRRINPNVTEADRIDVHVGRLRHAQPICAPGFAATLPHPGEDAHRGPADRRHLLLLS
ncbi:MAG: hypothetical protein ACRD3W_00860 [Terriglobales bacterium]